MFEFRPINHMISPSEIDIKRNIWMYAFLEFIFEKSFRSVIRKLDIKQGGKTKCNETMNDDSNRGEIFSICDFLPKSDKTRTSTSVMFPASYRTKHFSPWSLGKYKNSQTSARRNCTQSNSRDSITKWDVSWKFFQLWKFLSLLRSFRFRGNFELPGSSRSG